MRTSRIAVAFALAAVLPAATARADVCGASGARKLVVDTPRVESQGTPVDADLVRRFVRQKTASLVYCYERELLARPELAAGVVAVAFSIGTDGTVGTAKVNGFDAAVDTCLTSVIQGIAFPQGDVETVAHLSLRFGWDGEVFDAEACQAVPARLRRLATKLVRAIDGGDVDAFVALLPAKVEAGGRKVKKAKVKRAIATDGLEAWLGLFQGGWVLVPRGKEYALYRDSRVDRTPVEGEQQAAVLLRKSGKTWRVRGVVAIPRD